MKRPTPINTRDVNDALLCVLQRNSKCISSPATLPTTATSTEAIAAELSNAVISTLSPGDKLQSLKSRC